MKTRSILYLTLVFALILSPAIAAQEKADSSKDHATHGKQATGEDTKDEVKQSQKAAKAFSEIMSAPDKAIPQSVLDDAECVSVFPDVIKAGFIVGGRGGRGLVSCRVGNTWSAPVYLHLGGGSVGLQIGAQATDFVLLFMDRNSVESLLKSKMTLGADASVAAGPVGRQAGADTDLKFNAKILSYSRSKGLFAGLELKGVVIDVDKSDMRDVYGESHNARELLLENKGTVPPGIRAFPDMLTRYSVRRSEKANR